MASDLLGAVQLQGNLLVPLVRAVAQVLTVEGLDVLQIQVIGTLAASIDYLEFGICQLSGPRSDRHLHIAQTGQG